MDHSTPAIPRLRQDEAALFCIDIQERLVPAMYESERLIRQCALIVKAARQLEIPIFAVEHVPAKLGPTLPAIGLGEIQPVAKTLFSGAVPEVMMALRQSGKRSILLCGLETHVCLLQTALDLRAQGFTVYVVTNAVSSRYESDKIAGLARMASAGCVLGSTEMFIFELIGDAASPHFKALLPDLK